MFVCLFVYLGFFVWVVFFLLVFFFFFPDIFPSEYMYKTSTSQRSVKCYSFTCIIIPMWNGCSLNCIKGKSKNPYVLIQEMVIKKVITSLCPFVTALTQLFRGTLRAGNRCMSSNTWGVNIYQFLILI